MRSFLEKTGGQFFLLFFAGFYLIIAVCMQFRDVLANSESAILGVGVALTFFALWCFLGSMLLPYAWLEEREQHAALVSLGVIILPGMALVSALISQLTILLPERAHVGVHLINVVLMTLPIGLWTGGILAVLRGGGSLVGRWLNRGGLALGMVAGGVILALAVERTGWGNKLLLTAGILIILWAIGSSFRLLRARRARLLVMLTAIAAAACNLLIFYVSQQFLERELHARLPDLKLVRSVELPVGRMSFFQDESKDEYRIYLNRRLMWALPNDADLFISGLMPVMLQNLRPNLRILLVAPPFYNGVFLLAAMPQVGQIEVVCPYRSLLDFSGGNHLLSGFVKTAYFVADPLKFLQASGREYSAIIVIDPLLLPFGRTDEFIVQAREKLAHGGVFVMPASLTENPLAGYFGYMSRVPGCRALLMGSNETLFTNVKELGDKLDNFQGALNVTSFFPTGTFEVLYSLSERIMTPGREDEEHRLTAEILLAARQAPAHWQIILAAIVLGGYFWLRFLLVRHGNNALKITALENGICSAGVFYLVVILYQRHGLMLYRQLGLLLGLGGAVLLGELLPLRPLLRIAATAVSCLLPLVFFYQGTYDMAILTGAAAWMSVSAGLVNREIDRRRTVLTSAELSKWFLGGIFYGFAGILIFLLVANLMICCIVLMVLRLFALGMMFGARK